jgi:hypothetical protein
MHGAHSGFAATSGPHHRVGRSLVRGGAAVDALQLKKVEAIFLSSVGQTRPGADSKDPASLALHFAL